MPKLGQARPIHDEMNDGARHEAGRHRFLLDLMHDRSGWVLEVWAESELLVSGHPVGTVRNGPNAKTRFVSSTLTERG